MSEIMRDDEHRHEVVLPGENLVSRRDRFLPDRKLNKQIDKVDRETIVAGRVQQGGHLLTIHAIDLVTETHREIQSIELSTASPALSERLAFLADGEAQLHASTRNYAHGPFGRR